MSAKKAKETVLARLEGITDSFYDNLVWELKRDLKIVMHADGEIRVSWADDDVCVTWLGNLVWERANSCKDLNDSECCENLAEHMEFLAKKLRSKAKRVKKSLSKGP